MKTALILTIASLALQSRATTPTTKCNADNCARAVTGTAKGPATLAAHLADCSSFQYATFTPDTFFETVTLPYSPPVATPRPRGGRRRNVNARQGCDRGGRGGGGRGGMCGGSVGFPTHVPAYASACSGTVRFASACSCAGITVSTTSLEQVTVTITETEAAAPT